MRRVGRKINFSVRSFFSSCIVPSVKRAIRSAFCGLQEGASSHACFIDVCICIHPRRRHVVEKTCFSVRKNASSTRLPLSLAGTRAVRNTKAQPSVSGDTTDNGGMRENREEYEEQRKHRAKRGDSERAI